LDSVDNIKGIPGKGKVAAEKIMEGIKCPPARILKNYVEHFGEDEGIEQFYLNYKMLKILDKPAYGFNPADYELDTFKIK
jgi:5'-3' exonuclease